MRFYMWLAAKLNALYTFIMEEEPTLTQKKWDYYYNRDEVIAQVQKVAAQRPPARTMEEKLDQFLALPDLPEQFTTNEPSFFGKGFNLSLELSKTIIREAMQLPHRTVSQEFEAYLKPEGQMGASPTKFFSDLREQRAVQKHKDERAMQDACVMDSAEYQNEKRKAGGVWNDHAHGFIRGWAKALQYERSEGQSDVNHS